MSSGAAIPVSDPGVGDLGAQMMFPVHADERTCAKREEESPDLRNEFLVPPSQPSAFLGSGGSETLDRRRRPKLTARTLLTSSETPMPHSLDESDRRRTRSQTRHDGPQRSTGEFASEIRVGPDHQAAIPVMGSSGGGDENSAHDADVLWDPAIFSRQSPAVQKRALSLVGRERRLANQMLMMECLTAHEYDIEAAQAAFDHRMASHSTRIRAAGKKDSTTATRGTTTVDWSGGPPFPWSDEEGAIFESQIGRSKLEASAMATAVGRPKGEIISNYYWWKGHQSRVGKRDGDDDSDHGCTFSHRSSADDAPDECSICQKQGFLIVCDRCINAFHLRCLDPPLEERDIPDGGWYCPECASQLPVPTLLLNRAVPRKPRGASSVAPTRMLLRSTQKGRAGGSRPGNDRHSKSTPVPSSRSKPALEKKRSRESDSDESTVSDSDSGPDSDSDDDDDVVLIGTVSNASRTARRPTAASGTQPRSRVAVYEVEVPFRSDGTLGIVVSWNQKKKMAVVFSWPAQSEAVASNGTGQWFRASTDVILSVDGQETHMKSFEDVMEMCKKRSAGQRFKHLAMLHEHAVGGNWQSNPKSADASVSEQTPFKSAPVALHTPPDPKASISRRACNGGSAFHSIESNARGSYWETTATAGRGDLAGQVQGMGLTSSESTPTKSCARQCEVIDLTHSPCASPEPRRAESHPSSVTAKARTNDDGVHEIIDLTHDSQPGLPEPFGAEGAGSSLFSAPSTTPTK
jgi:PHD-finger/ELM2 domain